MGLDITAYEHFEMQDIDTSEMTDEQEDDLYEQYTRVYPTFPDQAEGLDGWVTTSGKEIGFRAGSYSGYNHWRRTLSEMAYGHGPDTLWEHPEDWKGKPFFELINFSDAEGIIGPKTSAKLAKDFRDNREKAMRFAEDNDYFGSLYDQWMEAFTLAADSGFVKFH